MKLIRLEGRDLDLVKRHADFYSDQWSEGEPGYGHVDDFIWFDAPAFPMRLLGGRRRWQSWLRGELIEEGIEHWGWLLSVPHEEIDPIIVVEGTDGRWYLWDGNHRVGVAARRGWKTLPALVGVRR